MKSRDYSFNGIIIDNCIYLNSALKYYTGIIALNTRVRLSEHVHFVYLEGTNFYKASNLGDNKIKNAYVCYYLCIEQFIVLFLLSSSSSSFSSSSSSSSSSSFPLQIIFFLTLLAIKE
jgi:hypothetical protein